MKKYFQKKEIKSIISKVDIIKIISKFLTLKKTTTGSFSICPFHSENTPSFFISEIKQKYYCFGCNKSGNIINFLMEYKKLDFISTINYLKKHLNIKDDPIEEKNEVEKSNLNNILNIIALIYHQNLKNSIGKNKIVDDFLKKRNLNINIIKEFTIGFAFDSWDFLAKKFSNSKIQLKLIELGLIIKKNSKFYDRFRNRIIFPIKNSNGEITGFGGRSLTEEKSAKYINSPESKLFSKRKELYGIYEAKLKNKKDFLIVVEGYLDVITLHKNELNNSVAVLGTNFTKEHFLNIRNFFSKIIFCFDGDIAGRNASIKTAYICLSYIHFDNFIGFVLLPQGEDPDSYIKHFGKEKFIDLFKNPIYLIDLIYKTILINLDVKFIYNKIYILNKLKNIANKVKDQNLRNFIFNYFLEKIKNNLYQKKDQVKYKNIEVIPFSIKACLILLQNRDFLHIINIKKLLENKNIKFKSDLTIFIETVIILNNNINISVEDLEIKMHNNFLYIKKFYNFYNKNINKKLLMEEFENILNKMYNFLN